jgi:hypothetical protein
VEWELPVSCANEDCNMIFRAFPELCVELEGKYNCETRMYEFICSNCNTQISSPRITIRGDLHNVALAAHWDGFTIAKCNNRNSWMVEVSVLNASTSDPIGLLPVLFIPVSGHTKNVMAVIAKSAIKFLQPFMLELEHIFRFGFEVEYYNYLHGV